MACERPDLLGLPVVADTDDRDCCSLDHVDDLGDSSPVTFAHAVDLVHNYEVLDQFATLTVQPIRVTLEEVHTLLVSDVTRVELGNTVLQFLGQQSCGRSLAQPGISAQQGCTGVSRP